jgi:DNA (cytosine-5)-methyltransferase 1
MMKGQKTFIDLFAGAGGLSEGFIKAGYKPIAHVEMDEAACYTLKTRTAFHYLKSKNKADQYIKYLKGEINREELYSLVPTGEINSVVNLALSDENNKAIFNQIDNILDGKTVDLIVGGPPCQAYSLVGRARSKDGMKNDPRNYLYVQYAKYLQKYSPKMFVFENVLGLESANNGEHLENMKKLFFSKGYKMRPFILEANNFGVLQNRKRIIIIGWRIELQPVLPDLQNIKIKSKFRVKDVLGDLPKIRAGEGNHKYLNYRSKSTEYLSSTSIRNGIDIVTQHIARPHSTQDKEIYKIVVEKWNEKKERLNYNDLPERLKTHKNRLSFFDRFKIVANDLPYSQTVVAHIAKDGHYYIHPDLNQNRSITIREAARLQSFPDDFYFEGVKETGSRTAAFKQIGNAVPPLMAYEIAKLIKAHF